MVKTNYYNFFKYFTYIILLILAIFIICYTFIFKRNLVKIFSLNKKKFSDTNENQFSVNELRVDELREGFKNSNKVNINNISDLMSNKIKGLIQELGGNKGKDETIKILKDTKKVCNLECSKCMLQMIDNGKSLKTIDIDNLLFNEDDENCVKCKKYTELSNTIQNIIDNL